MNKYKLLLITIFMSGRVFAQTPVSVIVDSASTTLYYLNSLAQVISTAQNTLQSIEYQRQSLESLSEGTLEGYSDFMAYQSLSTGAISEAIDSYKNTEGLIAFAGTDYKKSPEIYDEIVSGETVNNSDGTKVQYKNVNDELTNNLETIADTEWTSSQVLSDIDDYVMKTKLRQQQIKKIKNNQNGEVSQLQTMTQLLGVMADQNEDTIQLIYTQNLYEGTKDKLEKAKIENAKAQAKAQGEIDGAYYEDFGKGIFGDNKINIQSDIEKELMELEKNKSDGYGL